MWNDWFEEFRNWREYGWWFGPEAAEWARNLGAVAMAFVSAFVSTWNSGRDRAPHGKLFPDLIEE
jgi:hypothetical protein